MASVTLHEVVKVYENGVRVVDQLSLAIADREFVVLVGPSGCGKSTTLRMIAGLEDVTDGTIRIADRVVNDVPPKDRDIAMVFQSYALYPHMTVYENMAFALKLRKHSKASIEEKVRRAAKTLGIESLLDRKPRALSGGQRQRVALGRAIVRDPQCFLFDEPLSNLDAKLRVEMRAEIKRLQIGLGATTVYVTHDQEEAMTLGDRVVVMRDGVIQQCGSALDIYHRPQNRFVAGFLGNPPMNFLVGSLQSEADTLYFVPQRPADRGRLPIPSWGRAALEARRDEPVVLGIRPEAISPKDRARFTCTDNFLSLFVLLVQPRGAAMDVVLGTDATGRAGLGSSDAFGSNLIAHLDAASDLAVGQTLDMYFDMDRAHFFEPGDTGERITHRPS